MRTKLYIEGVVNDIKALSTLQIVLCEHIQNDSVRVNILNEIVNVELALKNIKANFDISETDIKRIKAKRMV